MDKIYVWVTRRKRKTGFRYAVQWIDPATGKTKTKACGPNADKRLAQEEAAKIHRDLLNAALRHIKPITFNEFLKEHITRIEKSLSSASVYQHDLALRQFKKICKPRYLKDVDFSMLERFRNGRLSEGVSPATINKSFRTLQGIFERAVKRNYLTQNPFQGNRQSLWLKEDEPEIVTLDPTEYQQLLTACEDDRWRAICQIAYFAGLRQGEIMALEWSDINFDDRILHVRNKEDHKTKSRKIRQITMTQEIVQAIQELQPCRFKSNMVFRGYEMSGQRLNNPSNVCHIFGKIVKRAGLVDTRGRPRFTLHDLRRSFTTNLLATGLDPKSVQELAGHADIQTTMKYYAGVRAKNLRSAIDKLSSLAASGA